jgi:hypothetical protein
VDRSEAKALLNDVVEVEVPSRWVRDRDMAESGRLGYITRARLGMAMVEIGDPDFAGEVTDESVLRALVSLLHATPREYDHEGFLARALEEYRGCLRRGAG